MTYKMNMAINKGAFRAYYNDFLTVSRFAEYHGWPEKKALRIINKGRIAHNEQAYNERSRDRV